MYNRFLHWGLMLLFVLLGTTGCTNSADQAIETVRTGYLGEYIDVTVEELLDSYYLLYDNSEWNGGETDDGRIIVEVTYTGEYLEPVKIQFTMKDDHCFKVTALSDPSLEKPKPTDVAGLLNDAYFQYFCINHEEIIGNFIAEWAFIETLSNISGSSVLYGASQEYSGDRSQLYQVFGDKPLNVNVPLLLDACGLLDLSYYAGSSTDFYDYIGDWGDSNSQRCYMSIEVVDDLSCSIQINWSSNASESTEWILTAFYNEQTGELEYDDCICFDYITLDDGEIIEAENYWDGTGKFYFEDGYLHWQDNVENAGSNCLFEN